MYTLISKRNVRIIIFRLILAALVVHTSLACVNVNVVCTPGSYANEVRWEIKQNGAVVTSGQGGQTKQACLLGNVLVTVEGRDTFGDSWNGATLKVVDATDGTEYLAPWTGPQNSDNKVTVTTTFYLPCPPGTYGVPPSCSNCSVGKFWTTFGKRENETSGCPYTSTTCPQGYFCNGVGGTAITPCSAGTFGNKSGLTASKACSNCTSGRYSTASGALTEATCNLCPQGLFCALTSAAPTPCSAGKYGNKTGQTVENEACSNCTSGKYSNSSGASVCTTCPQGHFCYGTGETAPTPCPAGTFGDKEESETCSNCTSGRYSNSSGVSVCTPCLEGHFCYGPGKSTAPTPCPAGKFVDKEESEMCSNCPSGKASYSGATTCAFCGSFMPLHTGLWRGTDCEPCVNVTAVCTPGSKPSEVALLVVIFNPNLFMFMLTQPSHLGLLLDSTVIPSFIPGLTSGLPPDGSTTSVCLGRGQYFAIGADVVNDGWNGATLSVFDSDQGTVYLAPWGGPPATDTKFFRYIPFVIPCLPGTYRLPQTFGCPFTICPHGFFCNSVDRIATPCPAGKYGNKTGQTKESEACSICPAGMYGISSGTLTEEACYTCPPGSYCNLTAIPCPAGKFGNKTGQTKESEACSNCKLGTYSTASGASTEATCTTCPQGSFCASTAAATPCPAGKYANKTGQTECSNCPLGKWNNYAGTSTCIDWFLLSAGFFNVIEDCHLLNQIDVSGNMEIVGRKELTTITAATGKRHFSVTTQTLTLKWVKLTGGDMRGDTNCYGNTWSQFFWGYGSDGGSIYINGVGTLLLYSSVLTNNTAGFGGSIFAIGGANIRLYHTNITHSTATCTGGGVFIFGDYDMFMNFSSSLYVYQGLIAHNAVRVSAETLFYNVNLDSVLSGWRGSGGGVFGIAQYVGMHPISGVTSSPRPDYILLNFNQTWIYNNTAVLGGGVSVKQFSFNVGTGALESPGSFIIESIITENSAYFGVSI
jgi:hypothetical protein